MTSENQKTEPGITKIPMSKQAQLESYPRRYIQPVQHGANLVFNTAGARKQQNQTSCSPQDARQRAEEALRRPTEESVAVVQSRQNQCSDQGLRRIHSERPTDRQELTNVIEARPRQPGDMIRVTHARINVSTKITNRGGWLNWNASNDDRVEGASSQAASRTQPDELRFRSIQLEAVAGQPLAHDLDAAVSEADGELGCIMSKTVIVEL